MKKVMKFVKGKREDENQIKNLPVESKKVTSEKNEKMEEPIRDDDFMCRDKSVTKLHKAVWNENSDKLKSIIKTHDIDITDRLDRTALYFAVLKNNPNIVNLLLENNANQNIPDIDGITPFLKSAQLGFTQCAAILLNYGADIKKTDKDSNSCVHFAVMGNHIDMLSFLITHHADCNVSNINGDYPLHIAVQMQAKQMIELLLNYNADITVTNAAGITPLVLAEQQANSEIVTLFNSQNDTASEYEDVSNIAPVKPSDKKYFSKNDSDADTWNDSPISSPLKKQNEKPVTKISKHFFNEETDISEEKSESDMSVKCSENTSPQSGIIPPPCKPLRSLEYLQSGMAMENRPVHLLTLGTVRTRHISMTESDHSKNNTPHRYSYQGDFHAIAGGDSVNKIPDHYSCAADEKGDSVNLSVKSKLLSKIECDSTMQSDWGSNESLPLDELSCGGRKDVKPVPGSTPKKNSNTVRDKTTDTFLQKQFSILEDYEKNHDQHCPVSRETEVLPKLDKEGNDSDSHLDDIGHLLEDNNRINAQLEKYAGQSDITLSGSTKSKSLPRNCEPSNSYHKGSFSLPRTLESGKDPFREMRSYGYFKPRSHFFSLKVLRGEKRSGFIDKLRNMFNKKSQVHLTGAAEANGTWLHSNKAVTSDADNEKYYQDASCSASEDSESKKSTHSDKMADNVPTVNVEDEEEADTMNMSFINNEQNKAIEKKFLSLSNMSSDSGHSRKSSTSQSHSGRSNCDDESRSHKSNAKKSVSPKVNSRKVLGEFFCEDCSDYLNLQLSEAEQNISSKEKFIKLLQDQLIKLQERNIQSINAEQEMYYKYSLASQELNYMSQVCKKYEDELHKLRAERATKVDHERDATKLREEADKWKKQYEDLIANINAVEKTSLAGSPLMSPELQNKKGGGGPVVEEEDWRSVIQNEVSAVITMLKENSQTVINSLEKQNKKLETLVEKLQNDLEASSNRQQELEKELITTKNELCELTNEAQNIKRDYLKSSEESVSSLKKENKRLKQELENITRMYTELQHEYENNVQKIEKDIAQSSQMTNDLEKIRGDYSQLASNVADLSHEVERMRDDALAKNDDLREQLQELDTTVNVAKYLNKVSNSLDSIVKPTTSTPLHKEVKNKEEYMIKNCRSVLSDIDKIHKLNSNMEFKLKEVGLSKTMSYIEDENMSIKEDWMNQSRVIENLEDEIVQLKGELSKHINDSEKLQDALQRNESLMNRVRQFDDTMQSLCFEIEGKDSTIKSHNSHIAVLSSTIKEFESRCDDLINKTESMHVALEKEKKSSKTMFKENSELKCTLDMVGKANDQLRLENENLQSTLLEAEKLKEVMDEDLKNALLTVSDLKKSIAASYARVENLETTNEKLKGKIEALTKNPTAVNEKELEEYRSQVERLTKENMMLKEKCEKEKMDNEMLQNSIDSLKFYHDNEMAARAARYDELKTEGEMAQNELQTEVNKFKDDNTVLKEKLGSLEVENKSLSDKILDLKAEIKEMHDKMQQINVAIESQGSIDISETKNEVSLSSTCTDIEEQKDEQQIIINETVSTTSAIVKNKDSKPLVPKKSSKLSVHSKKSSKIIEQVNSKGANEIENNCDITTIENSNITVDSEFVHDVLAKKISSIEQELHMLDNTAVDIKSCSMPNLDEYADNSLSRTGMNIQVLYNASIGTEVNVVRKASSLDCVSAVSKINEITSVSQESCKKHCKGKWDKHFESLQRLRNELAEIIGKLGVKSKDRIPAPTMVQAEHYKEIIASLQDQINELQVKAAQESVKYQNLQAELRGMKGQIIKKSDLEQEILNLRQELYKQRLERMQEIDMMKIKKESEMNSMQQKLREEYLQSKQKLLSDLASVQHTLQEKNNEEMKLKKKCEQLVKEVQTSQQARKKKISDISSSRPQQTTKTQNKVQWHSPEAKSTVHHVIQPLPVVKPVENVCACATILTANKTTSPILANARAKLTTTIEKHRLNAESAPPHSSQEEELKKKYLLK